MEPSESIRMKYLIGFTAFVLHAAWSANCSALTVRAARHSLTITGDNRSDLIEIVDYGAGSLTVNGTAHFGVLRLVIYSNGGRDKVTYDTLDELSLSKIQIDLGAGDDIADLNLGVSGADVQSETYGGAGVDELTTVFGGVPAGVAAESLMDGEQGNDVVTCVQQNVAGSVACISRGGAGNDHIFCLAENIFEGGEAECITEGGNGDDTIACAKSNVAGFASCVGDGGAGHDDLSCVLNLMTETGLGLCHQIGGLGNDTLSCETSDIHGEHSCFGDGGAGNDVVNSIVKGENSPQSDCSLFGGSGDDDLNIELGTFALPITVASGPVEFFADAGAGNDHLTTTANLTDESDATISSVTVLMGRGNDTMTLDFLSMGNGVLEEQIYDGGQGVDTYEGTVPAMFLPLVNFEIGL